MGYQPQHILSPDGTPLVVITAAEYERLAEADEDKADLAAATAALQDIANGSGTIPGEVLHPIIERRLTPVKSWRTYRGMSQAALARAAGISQVWVGRIEGGAGYGSPRVRQALAAALDAPDWSLDLGSRGDAESISASGETEVYASKSAHIRALLEQGLTRSEVAKRVGVRYQFVRNVEVATQSRRIG